MEGEREKGAYRMKEEEEIRRKGAGENGGEKWGDVGGRD